MENIPALERIEKYFSMPFERVISFLHWESGQSIKSLSVKCGVSRDTFNRHAKKRNLKLRGHKESILLDVPNRSHDKHWAYGKNKINSDWARKSSERMKNNNPSNDMDTLRRKQISTAKTYKNNMLPQEIYFSKILDSLGVKYIPQHPLDAYIIDFFISDKNLCIEIDSTFKWGKDRKLSAEKRDKRLMALGFKTLRINKAKLKDNNIILDILNACNIIGH